MTNDFAARTKLQHTTPSVAALWGLWIIASAVGGAVVGLLEARFQFLATLVLAGFVVGIAQWLVLRVYIARAWPWIIATGIGVVLGNLLRLNMSSDAQLVTFLWERLGLWEVFWLNVVNQPIVLGITSLLQWLILRRYRQSIWWIPISLVGGMLLGATSATFCYVGCDAVASSINAQVSTALTYASGWVAYGVVTGGLIARLIRAGE